MTAKKRWNQNLISKVITTLFILPVPIPAFAADLVPAQVVEQCMAEVQVVDNFEEYKAELNICYNSK